MVRASAVAVWVLVAVGLLGTDGPAPPVFGPGAGVAELPHPDVLALDQDPLGRQASGPISATVPAHGVVRYRIRPRP